MNWRGLLVLFTLFLGEKPCALIGSTHSENSQVIHKLSPHALKDMRASEAIELIDVRRTDEFLASHIQGAKSIPMRVLTPEQLCSPSKKIVIQCASGMRSKHAAHALKKQAPHLEIYTLEGGLQAWEQEGLPVIKASTTQPLPIMRQVQITAGLLIVFGFLLALFVSRFFLVLPLFIGCGLVFAGMTGWCGMAKVLLMMPWNS